MNDNDKKNSKANSPLERAVLRRMGQLNRIGTSKREAREAHNARLRETAKAAGKPVPKWEAAPHIFGIETFRQYTKICLGYATWLSQAHPDTSKLSYALKQDYAREFVEVSIGKGHSAWTVARTTAALAKLHGVSSGEIHNARPARLRSDIIRGRGYTETKLAEDINRFGAVAEIAAATGVRESELKTLKPSDFRQDTNGDLTLHLDGKANNTKGGRSREVEILPQQQARVKSILNEFNSDTTMFHTVSSRLNVHGIRAACYAQSLYDAVAQPVSALKGQRIADSKGRPVSAVYHCRDKTGVPRVYDRAALLRVSQSLGHSRASVVATHYLK